jgi:hypothetical protein
MSVIINELEIVLDASAGKQKADAPKAGGKAADPPKPPLEPQDVMTVMDREQRNRLRVMAY